MMRALSLYLIGMAAVLAFIGVCSQILFQAYNGSEEIRDFTDLNDAPFDVSDRIAVASASRPHNAGVLFIVCTSGGEMALVLRVKLQVEESYLRPGPMGKGYVSVSARRDDILKKSNDSTEFQFLLTLMSRQGLDTVVSPLMEPAALAPLAKSFGASPPEQVSVSVAETGTHMAGVVTAREITDFTARCR